mgnify:CR=1 FL=1
MLLALFRSPSCGVPEFAAPPPPFSALVMSFPTSPAVPCLRPYVQEWKARALLQSSSAVQCPTVAVQLAGTKKVQQVLGKREVLRRFLDQSSPDLEKQVDDMTSCFMGMYALEDSDEETLCALQRAVENPDDFLLKPQREGGGNLVYGEDLRTRVSKALQSHQQGTKKAGL